MTSRAKNFVKARKIERQKKRGVLKSKLPGAPGGWRMQKWFSNFRLRG
jgi:hypothetical protein